MSYSRHNISLKAPLREVRYNDGQESLVSEAKMRDALEEQYRKGFEAGEKALGEQLVEQRKQLLDVASLVLGIEVKVYPWAPLGAGWLRAQ